MKLKMFAILPALLFVAAVTSNLASLDWQSDAVYYIVSCSMIAFPFVILAIAHLTVANSRRSHVFLLSGNLVVYLAVNFSFFLLKWFQPGRVGVVFFSALMFCLGTIWAIGGFFLRDKQSSLT